MLVFSDFSMSSNRSASFVHQRNVACLLETACKLQVVIIFRYQALLIKEQIASVMLII